MKATLYLTSGETRVLDEQQLFDLGVRRPLLMGLPVLCADLDQAARVLGLASAVTLSQSSRVVAFAGAPLLPGPDHEPLVHEPLPRNPAADARLRALGRFYCQPCPRGPVLIVENVPVPPAQQVGQSYALLF